MAANNDTHITVQRRAHYSPPWADVSIIGIAGSSGSGKSSLSHAIVRKLNLPWVVILSMDSYYNTLNAEQSKLAFACEFDFDSPEVSLNPLWASRLAANGISRPSTSTSWSRPYGISRQGKATACSSPLPSDV